jgi:SNF2 family DNA or RNA helicase
VGFGFSTFSTKNETLMEDTPIKQLGEDDVIEDDDEAAAVAAAMKASSKDHKRLKKQQKKAKSSLEMLSSPKVKKSKVIYLDDDEEPEPNDDEEGDDEISVASHASDDEEQKTAAQVLNEANALSAKIVNIVGKWCGEQELTSNGMILGEGALSLGGGSNNNTSMAQDNEWISKETMKKILPGVELAEYQLLGVNWMGLLNRLTFMKGRKGKRDGKMNVNGILADEMGLGKVRCCFFFAKCCCLNRNSHVFPFAIPDCTNNCISGVAKSSEWRRHR